MAYKALDFRELTPERQAKADAQWAEIIAWMLPRRLVIRVRSNGQIGFWKKHPDET